MSIATLVLGESGTGKSRSLKNLPPQDTLLIKCLSKPLPFKSATWKPISKESPDGNTFTTDNASTIVAAMQKTRRNIIVIDDFQAVMSNEFFRRSHEKGFDRFNDIGRNAYDIITAATMLPDVKRVYILSHSETEENGMVHAKSIGKMLSSKLTIEGHFSIVLRTVVRDGDYWFSTQNNGNDTVKSPEEMFASGLIPNDLTAVDGCICSYYDIAAPIQQPA